METFVVRVWASADLPPLDENGGGENLRGRVEHVRSGRYESFHGQDHLLGFMRRAIERTDRARADGQTRTERGEPR